MLARAYWWDDFKNPRARNGWKRDTLARTGRCSCCCAPKLASSRSAALRTGRLGQQVGCMKSLIVGSGRSDKNSRTVAPGQSGLVGCLTSHDLVLSSIEQTDCYWQGKFVVTQNETVTPIKFISFARHLTQLPMLCSLCAYMRSLEKVKMILIWDAASALLRGYVTCCCC